MKRLTNSIFLYLILIVILLIVTTKMTIINKNELPIIKNKYNNKYYKYILPIFSVFSYLIILISEKIKLI